MSADIVATKEDLESILANERIKLQKAIESSASESEKEGIYKKILDTYSLLNLIQEKTINSQIEFLKNNEALALKYAEGLNKLNALETVISSSEAKISSVESSIESLKSSAERVISGIDGSLESSTAFQNALNSIVSINAEIVLLTTELNNLKEKNKEVKDALDLSLLNTETLNETLSQIDIKIKLNEANQAEINLKIEQLKEKLEKSLELSKGFLSSELIELTSEINKTKILSARNTEKIVDKLDELANVIKQIGDSKIITETKSELEQKEILKSILKNPKNFPPFRLNPLVDDNSDIFSQARETLNTAREILRLFGSVEQSYKDWETHLHKSSNDISDSVTAFNNIKEVSFLNINSVRNETEKVRSKVTDLLNIIERLKDDVFNENSKNEAIKNEIRDLGYIVENYSNFTKELKEEVLILRDDALRLKEQTEIYNIRVNYWYDVMIALNVPDLIAKVTAIQDSLKTLEFNERNKFEIYVTNKTTEFNNLVSNLRNSIDEKYNELNTNFISLVSATETKIATLTNDELAKLDIKSSEIKDELNTLNTNIKSELESKKDAYSATLTSLKEAAVNAIDTEGAGKISAIQSLATEKTAEIENVGTTKKTEFETNITNFGDSVSATLRDNFMDTSVPFLAILAKLNLEIEALKVGGELLTGNIVNETFVTAGNHIFYPNERNTYFVYVQGGRGYDNQNRAGGTSSFGSYISCAGGVGSPTGRGVNGESKMAIVYVKETRTLRSGESFRNGINVTVGEGEGATVNVSYVSNSRTDRDFEE